MISCDTEFVYLFVMLGSSFRLTNGQEGVIDTYGLLKMELFVWCVSRLIRLDFVDANAVRQKKIIANAFFFDDLDLGQGLFFIFALCLFVMLDNCVLVYCGVQKGTVWIEV